jgi:voltage-gated potassium channel
MFLMPFAQRGVIGRVLMSGLVTTVFLGAIYAISDSSRHIWGGAVLMLPPLVIQWLAAVLETDKCHLFLEPGFYKIPFYLYIIYLLSLYVFESGQVDGNRLAGAACIYLLLGTLWSNFYYLVEVMTPGAFNFSADMANSALLVKRELTYFSYVTLTTLGYGEITPVNPHARSLVMLESVIGVLYVGILVARLAGVVSAKDMNDTSQP